MRPRPEAKLYQAKEKTVRRHSENPCPLPYRGLLGKSQSLRKPIESLSAGWEGHSGESRDSRVWVSGQKVKSRKETKAFSSRPALR